MNAMLHQISPQVALTNFERIAKASSEMISTDIPASEVDRFMQLALEAKGQPVSTLSLVPPLINTAEPDIKLIRRTIGVTIARSQHPAGHRAKRHKRHTGTQTTVTGGSIGSLSSGYAANDASDLGAVC